MQSLKYLYRYGMKFEAEGRRGQDRNSIRICLRFTERHLWAGLLRPTLIFKNDFKRKFGLDLGVEYRIFTSVAFFEYCS